MDHGLWQSHRLPDNGHAVTPDLRPTPLLAVVGANHRGRRPEGAVPLQIDCGSRPSGLWIIIAHCIALRRHNRPTFDNRTIRLYSGVYSSPSAAVFTSSVIRCSSPSDASQTDPKPRRVPATPDTDFQVAVFPSHSHQRLLVPEQVCASASSSVSMWAPIHVLCPLPVSVNRLVHPSRSATTLACDASHRPHLLTDQIHHPQDTLFPTGTTNVTLCPPSRSDQRDDKHHGLPPPENRRRRHLILAASPYCIRRSTISSSSSLAASSSRPPCCLSPLPSHAKPDDILLRDTSLNQRRVRAF